MSITSPCGALGYKSFKTGAARIIIPPIQGKIIREFIRVAEDILSLSPLYSFFAIREDITGTIAAQRVPLMARGRWVMTSAFCIVP